MSPDDEPEPAEDETLRLTRISPKLPHTQPDRPHSRPRETSGSEDELISDLQPQTHITNRGTKLRVLCEENEQQIFLQKENKMIINCKISNSDNK